MTKAKTEKQGDFVELMSQEIIDSYLKQKQTGDISKAYEPAKEKLFALADKELSIENVASQPEMCLDFALKYWHGAGVKPEEEPQKGKLTAFADKLLDRPPVSGGKVSDIRGAYAAYEAAGIEPPKEKFGEATINSIKKGTFYSFG